MQWLLSMIWTVRYWWLDRQRKRLVKLSEERRRRKWDYYFTHGEHC